MIDTDEAYSIIEEKLDKMTPEERALFLKKMGFKFNSPFKGFKVRVGRTGGRREIQCKASYAGRAVKGRLGKKNYTFVELVDKKTKKKSKKANT